MRREFRLSIVRRIGREHFPNPLLMRLILD
jgi:hypothetical protein